MGCGASSDADDPIASSRPSSITLLTSSKTKFINNYELSSLVGKGATSEVYAGTFTSYRRLNEAAKSTKNNAENNDETSIVPSKYAIKVVKKANLDKTVEKLIRNEMHLLQDVLSHPNIIKLHEVYDEIDKFYLVFEYLEGGELFQRVAQKECFLEEHARDVTKKLFETMKYIHGLNIIHRDLKPENILLSDVNDDLSIKVADFGFAVQLPPGVKYTNESYGTPQYASPEIITNNFYGKEVDMWSLGCIVYMLLGGYAPFYDCKALPLFDKIKQGIYKFHPEYWDSVSEGPKDLISKLFVVDGDKRLTIDQALKHEWFQESYVFPTHSLKSTSSLRKICTESTPTTDNQL